MEYIVTYPATFLQLHPYFGWFGFSFCVLLMNARLDYSLFCCIDDTRWEMFYFSFLFFCVPHETRDTLTVHNVFLLMCVCNFPSPLLVIFLCVCAVEFRTGGESVIKGMGGVCSPLLDGTAVSCALIASTCSFSFSLRGGTCFLLASYE